MIPVDKYNLIVAGSGIAAQALVRRLAGKDLRILVMEGGLADEDPEYAKLTLCDEYGDFSNHYWENHWIRAYGGTSRKWLGWINSLLDRDFLGSSTLPSWPINRSDLAEYYLLAAKFLGRSESIITFVDSNPSNQPFIFKPFSNGEPLVYRNPDELSRLPNVDLVLGTNLIRLESGDRKSITGFWAYENGREVQYRLSPRQQLVLACGGLGNPQILLQPNPGSDTPVGNESGLAGKYLMEHLHTICAEVLINRSSLPAPPRSFGYYTPAFCASDRTYADNELRGCIISIENMDMNRESVSPEQEFLEKKFNTRLVKALGYSRSEQEPQLINSAQITAEKNWAGLHKLRTQCAFSTMDLYSIDRTTRLFAEYLYNHNMGTLRIDNDSIYRQADGGGHTMGTTRMGTGMQDSVCDRNCKVHSYGNLHLAGSSVFTTSGASNPTLTIAALSIRLADHLRSLIT